MSNKFFKNNIHRLQLIEDEDIYIVETKPLTRFRDIDEAYLPEEINMRVNKTRHSLLNQYSKMV
jgi:hypothetical protein